MSLPDFPSLPGLDISVKRRTIFSNLTQTGASGKRFKAAYTGIPLYGYDLTFNFLRQAGFSPQTAADELKALSDFFEQMYGSWGTFNFTDPLDGTPRICSFDQDTLDLERVVALCWKGASAVKLITVK